MKRFMKYVNKFMINFEEVSKYLTNHYFKDKNKSIVAEIDTFLATKPIKANTISIETIKDLCIIVDLTTKINQINLW